MDKKMIFGILLTIIGLSFSAICFVDALLNPCIYNGIDGLLGAFLGQDTLIPFVISFAAMILGVGICYREAFREKK